MDKSNIIFYKQKHIKSFEFSEIDFDLQDEIGFNYEVHDNYVDTSKDRGRSDGYPIQIDRMIDKLQELKAEGASHVSLDYHIDHIGYVIDAWKISKLSQDEIDEYLGEKEEKKKKTIAMKKAELKKQLEELERKENEK